MRTTAAPNQTHNAHVTTTHHTKVAASSLTDVAELRAGEIGALVCSKATQVGHSLL
jgi:hypothetical protein